jgi:UDP-2-acetamido-2,6-beta-L-arabino-hexul-4-ose reductase
MINLTRRSLATIRETIIVVVSVEALSTTRQRVLEGQPERPRSLPIDACSLKAGDTTSVRSGVRSTRAIRATRVSFSRVRGEAPQDGVGRSAKEATTMTHVALTGGDGFLGWHTRCAAMAASTKTVHIPVGDGFSVSAAAAAISGSSRFLHIAGINRGSDEEVHVGNVLFATQAARAVEVAEVPPPVIAFANSIQVGNGSVYGAAKAEAADILAAVAARVGAQFVDVCLPNIYGEHGRPFYNSVVSTFCHLLATGGIPRVHQDKEMRLLHAQDAADVLLGNTTSVESTETSSTVGQLLATLCAIAAVYSAGEIPSLESPFERNLFNTYRSFTFDQRPTISPIPRPDEKGSLGEVVWPHGRVGQFSFFITAPGEVRASHFHRRKVERLTPVQGTAVISLRRLFHADVIDIHTDAARPVAVDVPTMWAHRISNEGPEDFRSGLWSNEVFDPSDPDTFPEEV